MSLFGSPRDAWHSAYSARVGLQDPFSQKVHSTSVNDMEGVREAELAKVVRVIGRLDASQNICGMWCYLPPEHEDLTKYRNRVYDFLWAYCISNLFKRLASFQRTTSLQIMVVRAAEDARSRSGEQQRPAHSHAQVASYMGISRQAFLKTWRADYESLVSLCLEQASIALSRVSVEIESINYKYSS